MNRAEIEFRKRYLENKLEAAESQLAFHTKKVFEFHAKSRELKEELEEVQAEYAKVLEKEKRNFLKDFGEMVSKYNFNTISSQDWNELVLQFGNYNNSILSERGGFIEVEGPDFSDLEEDFNFEDEPIIV